MFSLLVCFLFKVYLINDISNIFDVNERWNKEISLTSYVSFSMMIGNSIYELVLYCNIENKLNLYSSFISNSNIFHIDENKTIKLFLECVGFYRNY